MLKPEVSVPTSAVVIGLVYALHQNATPTIADVRTSVPGSIPHDNVNRAERQATWMSIALVSGISLLAKDTTIFVTGGAAVVALAWWERYNNEVYPTIGKVLGGLEGAAHAAQVGEQTSPAPAAPAVNGNPFQAVM